jgi:ABC-2 type transport system permease protein
MWRQIAVIAWAQFRTMRNHLPRTSTGAILVWILSLIWYGLAAALAVALARALPEIPIDTLRAWMPVGLLGVFAFWQLVPLFTLSSGWSLQLNKLQIYPVANSSLFGIEVFLRITSAPEMILVLTGVLIGLLRHPALAFWPPFALLLLFVPFNLFLSLGIRELILHSFDRKGFRELFAVLLISIGVLPQLLFAGKHEVSPRYLAMARSSFTPWHGFAAVSTGLLSAPAILQMLLWTAAAYVFARRQFQKSLVQEDAFRSASSASGTHPERRASILQRLFDIPSRLFADPLGALLQKEFQSLLRMPRFRVIFGMACVFSVIIFIPIALNSATGGRNSFISHNFLVVVTLYGVLMMGDVLLLNIFGLDRRAAQIYFVAPVSLETVVKAKNLTAVTFIALQSLIVLLIAALIRVSLTAFNILDAVTAAAVVGVFFLCIGNLTSIAMARPIDPTQTFKKQAGAKMQLWILLCSLGMFVLVGFAFLARWALDSEWAMPGVLAVEFAIGVIFYRVATQSGVERAVREREQLLEALSKGPSPVGLGT